MNQLRGSLTDADAVEGIEPQADPVVQPHIEEVTEDEPADDFLSDDDENGEVTEPEVQQEVLQPHVNGSTQPSIFDHGGGASTFGAFGKTSSTTTSAFGTTAFAPSGGSDSSFNLNPFGSGSSSSGSSAFKSAFSQPGQSAFGSSSGASAFASGGSIFGQTPTVNGSSAAPHQGPVQPSTAGPSTMPSLFNIGGNTATTLSPAAPAFVPTSAFSTPPASAPVFAPSVDAPLTFTFDKTSPTPPSTTPPPSTSATASTSAFTQFSSSQPLFAPASTSSFLPKLNTDLPSTAPSQASPMLPPAPKPQPVSLPSTPTVDGLTSSMGPPPPPQHRAYTPSVPSPLRPSSGPSSTSSSSNMGPPPKKEKPLLKGALLGKLDMTNLPFSASPSKVNGDESMLSPLVIGSPSVSRAGSIENMTGVGGLGLVNGISGSPIVDKGKGRQVPFPLPPPSKQDGESRRMMNEVQEKLEKVERREDLNVVGDRVFVGKVMRRWVAKTQDRAEYKDAVTRSVRYGKQVRSGTSTPRRGLRDSSVGRGSPALSETSKRRRAESDAGSDFSGSVWSTSGTKRRKRRSSGKYEPPRTDAQLERRLLEVVCISMHLFIALIPPDQKQKETAIRWSPNSFLDHIKMLERTHLHSHRFQEVPHNRSKWTMWVSCNPENDGTAIWVEKKFGVVSKADETSMHDGKWVTDGVYQIPVSEDWEGRNGQENPGVLVFELSPLEGVLDSLER